MVWLKLRLILGLMLGFMPAIAMVTMVLMVVQVPVSSNQDIPIDIPIALQLCCFVRNPRALLHAGRC